jgi:hypothetical protein
MWWEIFFLHSRIWGMNWELNKANNFWPKLQCLTSEDHRRNLVGLGAFLFTNLRGPGHHRINLVSPVDHAFHGLNLAHRDTMKTFLQCCQATRQQSTVSQTGLRGGRFSDVQPLVPMDKSCGPLITRWATFGLVRRVPTAFFDDPPHQVTR